MKADVFWNSYERYYPDDYAQIHQLISDYVDHLKVEQDGSILEICAGTGSLAYHILSNQPSIGTYTLLERNEASRKVAEVTLTEFLHKADIIPIDFEQSSLESVAQDTYHFVIGSGALTRGVLQKEQFLKYLSKL